MSKVVGIVNLHSNVSYKGLTEKRPVASVSFLGRYGIIDFVLSNMSNSNVDTVGVLIKEKPRSLFKHLGNGNSWNFNSKSGGVSLLYNEKYANNPMYNHDINNLVENIAFLEKSKADYVVVAPAHIITTMNYAEVVEAHQKSGAEITVVYQKITNANTAFVGSDYLRIKGKQVVEIKQNKGNRKERNISLETYVFNTKVLLSLMNYAKKVSSFFDLKDTLAYICDERKIMAYEYKGFARCIDSYEAYYKTSLEFLDMDINTQVFKSTWPIFTNTNDTPPTKYKKNAKVKKSFVANGVIVDGEVEGSILSRNVVIGKNAVVKNCIILNGSYVCPNAHLENVIIDKDARIEKMKELVSEDEPLYVKEGDVV
ncbi:MAG: glucose-1-phosphate adenylyltransferase subunit GlgD [Coprobacillus sp.]|jgi:glucose-1-phosphate adenylyltransferase|nr:glucose-1-phosphate adenylyltransferase subunit GlgD [Coprobacillus sp.]MCI9093341.1 glucose-1-phosphate adenylyltransferase subunit GlgD [Coprobacillus sp.]